MQRSLKQYLPKYNGLKKEQSKYNYFEGFSILFTTQKMKFPLRIFLMNVNKSEGIIFYVAFIRGMFIYGMGWDIYVSQLNSKYLTH